MAKAIRFRLRQLRREVSAKRQHNITLKEISQATGIAISTLSRLESGASKGIELVTLAKLADFYSVSSGSDLLDVVDENTDPRLAA